MEFLLSSRIYNTKYTKIVETRKKNHNFWKIPSPKTKKVKISSAQGANNNTDIVLFL